MRPAVAGLSPWVLSLIVNERIAPIPGRGRQDCVEQERDEQDRVRNVRTTALVIAILAFANVTSNRLMPAALYVPWNVAVAVGIVLLARRVVTERELGLGEWRRGFQFGMLLVVVTLAVLLMGLAMPAVNDLFHDRRVGAGAATLLYQAVIRIPFGTVLLEEIAFRSVLPALVAKRHGVIRGSLAASALFGLWHVLPALNINEVNPIARDVFGGGVGGKAVAVLFAVAATMFAGLWLCLIRYRSRSVLASMLGHIATNSIGFTIAWFVGGG